MKHCSVEIDLARYLADEDRSEDRQEYKDQVARDLLTKDGECYPFTELNVDEAWAFINFDAMATLMQSGDAKAVGELIMSGVRGYWEIEADKRAAKIMANECFRLSKEDDF